MDIFGNNPNNSINDGNFTDSTLAGSTTIVTQNGETYNLETPDNGDNLDVLTTDGSGNTYWAPSGGGGGTPTLQQVYDASANPARCTLVYGKNIEFQTEDSDNILSINANTSTNFEITAERAYVNFLNSTISTSGSFIKNGGTSQQYLMADGSTSAKFNQNLNTTDSVSFNSVALTAAITTNTQATTKLYVDNKVGTIAITSTDNNLLGVSGVNPTFSLTPKYTYMITFGGNNNNTTAQWLLPGSVRTATISNTNVATHQALIPINSTLVWASIQRTTTTGVCSLAYSVSNGVAVPITPTLTVGQAQNPVPYPLNVNIVAGANLAMSVLSSVLSGNTIVSLLLRSN